MCLSGEAGLKSPEGKVSDQAPVAVWLTELKNIRIQLQLRAYES